MDEAENEYGCTRCQAWHGESDGPVYAEHITFQSKHGLRRRPAGGWQPSLPPRTSPLVATEKPRHPVTDDAAVERYARDGIHAERMRWSAATDGKFIPCPWDERVPRMRELDRRMAAAVAVMAVRDAVAEVRQCITTFLAVNGPGGNAGDLAEGIRQILDREPLNTANESASL